MLSRLLRTPRVNEEGLTWPRALLLTFLAFLALPVMQLLAVAMLMVIDSLI